MRLPRPGPTLVLFVLPGLIAELLSGATPPLVFLFPPVGLFLIALYGSGVVVVRELARRWHKGWPSLFVLGAAFAVCEEALGTRAMLDPSRMELSPLVGYGPGDGLNLLFTVHLLIYHAVFSVATPIYVAELLYPNRRGEPWVSNRGVAILCVVFAACLCLAFFTMNAYRPPAGALMLSVLAVVLFVAIARVMGRRHARLLAPAGPPRLRVFWALGIVATLAFFIVSWGSPGLHIPPAIVLLLLLAISLGVPWQAHRWVNEHDQTRQMTALVCGGLTYFAAVDVLLEALGHTGSSLLAVVAAVAIWRLWRLVSQDGARKDMNHVVVEERSVMRG